MATVFAESVFLLRKLAKEYENVTLTDAKQLLHSSYHEDRLLALLMLVRLYSEGNTLSQ